MCPKLASTSEGAKRYAEAERTDDGWNVGSFEQQTELSLLRENALPGQVQNGDRSRKAESYFGRKEEMFPVYKIESCSVRLPSEKDVCFLRWEASHKHLYW